ncbi:MAG: hypothetical protein ABJQ23_04925 [Shimia thalassica]|uniref:hypothetical protein n=1 Tax=Shimia thalassica TaxID=1715693 RepID=UPI00329941E2
MTETIEDLKAYVNAQLRLHCEPVPPKTDTSQQVHLSVWTKRGRRKAIGVELDHADRVNLWVVSMYVPISLPKSVIVANKVWHGSAWRDKKHVPGEKERGANSNLKGYDEFRRKPITRLGIQSMKDAQAILGHLFS